MPGDAQSAERPAVAVKRFLTLKRVMAAVILLVLAVLGFGWAALRSDFLLPLRQSYAQSVLRDVVGREVEVRGPVSVTLADTIGISVHDAHIADETGQPQSRLFQEVSFEISYASAWAGEAEVHGFGMYGAIVDLSPSAPEAGAETGTETRSGDPAELENRWDLAKVPSALLKSPVVGDLRLSEVVIVYRDPANGWDESLVIDILRMSRHPESGDLSVSLKASANGFPITVTGTVRDDAAGNATRKRVALATDMSLLTSGVEGVLDVSSELAMFEGHVSARAADVRALMNAFGFETGLAATADLSLDLKGRLGELSAENLSGVLTTAQGDRATLEGGIANLQLLKGIDLRFGAELAVPEALENSGNAFVTVTGFNGRLIGEWDALRVQEGHVFSTLVAFEFDDLGPISVSRVVKRPDNRIALHGIRIVDGPPQGPPYLSMVGSVEDALDVSGMRFSGTFRVPTVSVLDLSLPDPSVLGAVAGQVALSDETGLLGLTRLDGGIEDTELVSSTFSLNVPALRMIDRFLLETEFTIPDLLAYGMAVGAEISGPPTSLAFKGRVALEADELVLDGQARAGSSGLALEASVREEAGDDPGSPPKLRASGAIKAGKVSLADFDPVIDLLASTGTPDLDGVELNVATHDDLVAHFLLGIDELNVDGKKAGSLKGEMRLEKRVLSFTKLSLRYLSGAVSGSFSFDLRDASPRLTAEGRIEKFNLARLLRELGLRSPVTSTVYASFKFNAATGSMRAFLRSLNGRVTASLWGGNIPTDMIDLASLNMVSWLFPPADKASGKFVCAVLPFSFKNGVAFGKPIVVETGNAQLVGEGSVNFRKETVALKFVPRPKRRQAVDVVTPFEIRGTLANPKVVLLQATAGRAVGEVLSLPFNLVGRIFGGAALIDEKARPCVLPKARG